MEILTLVWLSSIVAILMAWAIGAQVCMCGCWELMTPFAVLNNWELTESRSSHSPTHTQLIIYATHIIQFTHTRTHARTHTAFYVKDMWSLFRCLNKIGIVFIDVGAQSHCIALDVCFENILLCLNIRKCNIWRVTQAIDICMIRYAVSVGLWKIHLGAVEWEKTYTLQGRNLQHQN